VFAREIRLSGAAGRSAPALAEHALYFMLALSYDAPVLFALQDARRWAPFRPERRRALAGRTLGIIGLGHTGQALAVRALALDMRVVAVRRRVCAPPPGVAEVFAADAGGLLTDLLGQSDIVALAASLSDRTHRMIDDAAIACMRPSALLINVARGGLIDERALVRALRRGRLAGAGLDTVAREPLSVWSPLWRAPNLLITPHQTPPLADRSARSLAIACENLRRYRADAPLLNEVGPEDVYSQAGDAGARGFSPRALVARMMSAKRGLPR
jgi:phosphoglycerate dehydrogenase-like enzyme